MEDMKESVSIKYPGELKINCRVVSLDDAGGDVWRVCIELPESAQVSYHAGQYLLLEHTKGGYSAFSIVSIPESGRVLELHILVPDKGSSAACLIEQLRTEGRVHVRMPYGTIYLDEPPARGVLLLAAAGAGMAQITSLMEFCRTQGCKIPIHLYWGMRHAGDFYEVSQWKAWESMPNVQLHKVVSDSEWAGRSGMLFEALHEDLAKLGDLRAVTVFLSGSAKMIFKTGETLIGAGIQREQIHADLFAYPPLAD